LKKGGQKKEGNTGSSPAESIPEDSKERRRGGKNFLGRSMSLGGKTQRDSSNTRECRVCTGEKILRGKGE